MTSTIGPLSSSRAFLFWRMVKNEDTPTKHLISPMFEIYLVRERSLLRSEKVFVQDISILPHFGSKLLSMTLSNQGNQMQMEVACLLNIAHQKIIRHWDATNLRERRFSETSG